MAMMVMMKMIFLEYKHKHQNGKTISTQMDCLLAHRNGGRMERNHLRKKAAKRRKGSLLC